MKKIKYFIIGIFLLGLISQIAFNDNKQFLVFAIESQYSNQLLKLNIEKANDNTINIKLYTSQAYPIQLSPIKKSKNEYLIFLPETYHSITSKPDISSLSDYIEEVDIKLIPYTTSNTNNGYTRILIKANREDIKLNIDNEASQKDLKFQEELSKLLVTRTNNHAELKQKKTVASPNNKETTRTISTSNSSKPVSSAKTKSPTSNKSANITTDNKKTNIISTKSQENTEKKPKTTQESAANKKPADTNKEKIEPKISDDIKAADSKATLAANTTADLLPEENNPTTQNTSDKDPLEEPQENQINSTDISANSSIDTNVPTNLASVQTTKPKSKKSSLAIKILIPILLFIVLMLGIRKIIKKLNKKHGDFPIKLGPQKTETEEQQPIITPEIKQDTSESTESNQETTTQNDQEPLQENQNSVVRFQSQPKTLSSKTNQEDIISRLSRNPTKPTQYNPLKSKTYTEISPNELDQEFYNLKTNKNSATKTQNQNEEIKFIAGIEVEAQKGFYLVQIENDKALIGIVNSEIFLLNKFDRISSPKFTVRKTSKELETDKDVYFVRVGNWCALISNENNQMKLETVF